MTTVDLDRLEASERTIRERGILLPYRDERRQYDAEQHKLVVTEVRVGEVFVNTNTLADLAEQDRWDSSFGKVLLIDHLEGLALEQAGLAEHETRGGYHRTDLLRPLLERLELY